MGTRGAENKILTSRRRPPWIELPGDLTENILRRLGAEEILKSAEKVCITWKNLCLDPAMWCVVHLTNSSGGGSGRDFNRMCRRAVDRSQGQLIDLSITGFGGDELMKYIADRSSHLRRLTLDDLGDTSAFGLTAAVKKLTQLTELHLTSITPLDAEDIKTIGISCPLLNSFTYNEKWDDRCCYDFAGYECNEIALAVAETMPNLHRLRLSVELDNERLEAILDGCPLLESLDLWDCYGLHLRTDLGKRCSKQIMNLRLRNLPSYDEFETSYDDFDVLDSSEFYDDECDYDSYDEYY